MPAEREEPSPKNTEQIERAERLYHLGRYLASLRNAEDPIATLTGDMTSLHEAERESQTFAPIVYPTPLGNIILDVQKKLVTSPFNPDTPVTLGEKELLALAILTLAPENILDIKEVARHTIEELRRKLSGDSSTYPYDALIKSVRGKGYYVPSSLEIPTKNNQQPHEAKPESIPFVEFESPNGHSLTLYTSRNVVFSSLLGDSPARLSTKESQILELLMKVPSKSFPPHFLEERFGISLARDFIKFIRDKIGDKRLPTAVNLSHFQLIHNARGRGYSLTNLYDIQHPKNKLIST